MHIIAESILNLVLKKGVVFELDDLDTEVLIPFSERDDGEVVSMILINIKAKNVEVRMAEPNVSPPRTKRVKKEHTNLDWKSNKSLFLPTIDEDNNG